MGKTYGRMDVGDRVLGAARLGCFVLGCVALVGCSAHGKVHERYDEYEERTQVTLTTIVRGTTDISPILRLVAWNPALKDEKPRMELGMQSGDPLFLGCQHVFVWIDGKKSRYKAIHTSGKASPAGLGDGFIVGRDTRGVEFLSFEINKGLLKNIVQADEARVAACGYEYWVSTKNAKHIIRFYEAVW